MFCDVCKENPAIKMIQTAVRTLTHSEGELSAQRFEFKAIPMCEVCLKARNSHGCGASKSRMPLVR